MSFKDYVLSETKKSQLELDFKTNKEAEMFLDGLIKRFRFVNDYSPTIKNTKIIFNSLTNDAYTSISNYYKSKKD